MIDDHTIWKSAVLASVGCIVRNVLICCLQVKESSSLCHIKQIWYVAAHCELACIQEVLMKWVWDTFVRLLVFQEQIFQKLIASVRVLFHVIFLFFEDDIVVWKLLQLQGPIFHSLLLIRNVSIRTVLIYYSKILGI